MKVDVGQFLAAAAQLVVVLGGLGAGYVWFRHWVKRVAADSEHAVKQLATSNGKTAGQLIEQTAKQVTELSAAAAETRALAQEALTLAKLTDERLDRHLVGHDAAKEP